MNSNYLDLLPDEMLLKLLSETDDLKTLAKWCQTSKRVNQICLDEGFWRNKYRKDFGFSSHGETILMEGETWRKRYKQRTIVGINSPISGKSYHYGIIDQNGILYMAGENDYGQLGNGTTINSTIPMALQFKQKIIGISCASYYTVALTADGKIYLWGNLGDLEGIDEFITGNIERTKYNQMENILTPRLFNFPHPAIKIYAGSRSLGIIAADQTPYFTNYKKPINIKAIDIAPTENKYVIIGVDRKLYMWGRYYVTGDVQKYKNVDQPQHFPVPELVKQVSRGEDHYAVLSVSGNVYIWGSNEFGALGISSATTLKTPTKLDFPSPISFISMGLHTSAALTEGGKLYMWGANSSGKILNEDQAPDWVNLKPTEYDANLALRPIEISIEGKMINYVEVGPSYTLAVTDDGVVNYWGNPTWSPE